MTRPNSQILFLMTGAIVIFLLLLLPQISLTHQLILVGLFVSLFGLPHGAVDGFIAKRIGLWRTPTQFLMFISLYLTLAALVVLAWQLAPVIALAAFFAVSAWHFGADFAPRSNLERLVFGALLLSLPAVFAPLEIRNLLGALSGPDAIAIAIALETSALPLFLAAFLIKVHHAESSAQMIRVLMPIFGLFAFASVMPPLIYFAVYFCTFHSARHFGAVLELVPPNEQAEAVLHAAIMTALTLLFAAIVYVILLNQIAFETVMTRIIFVGLAALTIPHMVLVDGLWHRQAGTRP